MIIGITGTDGAGKGSVVEYLVNKKGFVHYSARALFIEEIEKRGLPNDRNQMRLIANEFRKEYGNDFVASVSLRKIKEAGTEKAIVESIRAVAEANTLKAEGAILLAVDAEQELRYERVQSRRSETDAISFEEFTRHEQLEMDDPDPNGMQKAEVMKMADYTIKNNGSIEALQDKIEEFLLHYEN